MAKSVKNSNKVKRKSINRKSHKKNVKSYKKQKIRYQAKGPVIQRELYDVPESLTELISFDHWYSHSQLNNALNKWIPSINKDYAKHFHNLYYLEEIGLRKQIKTTYNQIEAYFDDTETTNENGKIVRKKYEHGVYDVVVKDLSETRPTLKIGEK